MRARSLLLALILIALFAASVVSAFEWTMPDWKRMPPRTEAAQVPSPTHIEWTEHPVGGLLICHPPDSTGTAACLNIPAGSILLVPHPVEGADPDSHRKDS